MTPMLRVPREDTSLRQRTTNALRTAILDGVLAAGQKLSERELCESLDVSRSCLRESLQHLQAEGLITIIPHKGPEVTSISVQEVRDIYEVRTSLESLAGRGFALNATPAQRQALRAKLDELGRLDLAQDKAALLTLKNQFYDILIEGCGNLVAGQMLKQLNNRVTVLRRISMSQPGRMPQTLAELDAIVTAIEKGDAQTAAALCGAHVQKAGENLLRSMAASVQPGPAD
ncbi:GntR family transcriptional regulator [Comamonas endophytica]|uniref:GntR family transcriptional regulator n=1 Tax=Comamonas endophytica TaxID=2949090 RepID=A0ABY6GEV7_9BURK|nr:MULTISPECIES: GntR family transcriptional regulator [unclassified Acidovorax]MCD2514333.1 GntR family transcriptional regulator [Acidovorax sp. D4N7]UYG53582.1 GntR family transcriptional regulator [Acidovorax sp. 5MLIR]UYG53626.1 GntR family transcriptional regulator [Acidovorax sp. 5MLIR]